VIAYALEWEREPARIKPFPEQVRVSYRNGVMGFSRREGETADPDRTFMPTGQGAGLVDRVRPAAEVFANLLHEAEETLRGAQSLLTEKSLPPGSAAPHAPAARHG